MSYAADAVVDVVAPPPRAGASARATPSAPGESFDDHLDAAATAPEAERSPADAATTAEAPPPEDQTSESADTVVTPQPAPPTTTAPVIIQLINAESAPTPPAESTASVAGPPPVDAPIPPLLGAEFDVAPPSQAPPSAEAQPVQQTGKSEGAEIKSAPQQSPPAQASIATVAQPQAAAAQQAVQAQTPQPAPSPTTPIAAPALAATAPTPQPVSPPDQRPLTARVGKTAPSADGKSAPPDEKALLQAATAAKSQTRSAPTSPIVADAAPVMAEASQSAPQAAQTISALTTSTAHAAQTQHAALDTTATRAAPAAAQVAREIVRRFDGESTKFELRLDPPELGRVEVRLEVSRDHKVTAVVSADSPQALTELARHARELEQTLQSAGLELNDNGLSFDLRQSRDDADGAAEGGGEHANDDAQPEAPITARPIGLERWRGVRIDMMV